MPADQTCDIAIAGGGLAGGLVAYALSVKRPELSIRVIDPAETFGGNHVWSFFSSDIDPGDRWIIDPFIDHRWDTYEVRFPRYARKIPASYNSIRSGSFDTRLRSALGEAAPVRGAAVEVSPTTIYLEDQSRISAGGVLDARGAGDLATLDFGWQKFIGQELRTVRPHGLDHPIVMDATVDQIDGYRFIYVLPFGPDRLFIEDTYYSDTPEIDRSLLVARIADYASAHGWDIAEVLHEEIGALPVTMGGDFDRYLASGGSAAKIGVRAALFHGTTGFSLPDAVRTASYIASLPDLSGAAMETAMRRFATERWAAGRFYRLLDRLLFRVADPEKRYKVLERFYTLRPGLIGRFYAGRTNAFDKMRILAGKPPVPFFKAFTVLKES